MIDKSLLQNSATNNLSNLQENFVNNPINGANPSFSPQDVLKNAAQDLAGSLPNSKPGPYTGTKTPFSELPTNGRYKTFFPGLDNEDIHGETQDSWDKWGNAIAKFSNTAATTFVQGTAGLVYGLGKWIEDGQFSSLYDNDFSRTLDTWNKQVESQMPTYYTQEENDASWYSPKNLFTANFWSDKILKNLGFAAGAILSGGLYGGVVRGAGSLTAKLLPKFGKIVSAGGLGELAAASETAMANAPKASRLAALNSSFENIASKYATRYDVLNKTQRAITAGLATAGEASIEAMQTMNTYRDELVNDYYDSTGQFPTGAELEKINNTVENAGNVVYGLNTALLTMTNYIQFPKVLGSSYTGEKRAMNEAVRNNIGKIAVKDGESTAQGLARTSTNQTYVAAKATTKFGRMMDNVKNYGRFVFSPSEAFEEGSQNVIQVGVQNYYDRKYNGDTASVFQDMIGEGMLKTLTTKQGLESILIGGLSGAISEGTRAITARQPLEHVKEQRNTQAAVAAFNKSYLGSYLKDGVDSMKRATSISADKEEALKAGDILTSKDLEHDFIFNYLTPRVKYGKKDIIDDDINTYKQLANSDQGLQQLKDDGIIDAAMTKEQFIAHLDTLQGVADTVAAQYEALNLRYAGLVDKSGERVFSDDVIEKMLYSSSKVDNYNKRITDLSKTILEAGIDPELVLSIAEAGPEAGNMISHMIRTVDGLNMSAPAKDVLKQNMGDVLELSKRRKHFLDEYETIKNNPKGWQETVKENLVPETDPVAPSESNPTISLRTKDGDEDIEIGVEYYAGSQMEPATFGNSKGFKQKFSRFTVLGETEDGKIVVRTQDGKEVNLEKNVFNKYKLGKVADTENNKKAKYFMENINSVFEYNFGKGRKVKGRLEYSPKQNTLLFVYRNQKNEVRKIEVTNDMFVAKTGYDNAQIKKIGELTETDRQYIQDYNDEVRRESKLRGKVEVLQGLVENKRNTLTSVENDILDQEIALEDAKKELAEVRAKIEEASIGKDIIAGRRTSSFKKGLKALMNSAQTLANFIQDTEAKVNDLSEQATDLENEISFLDESVMYAGELPDGMALVDFLKDIRKDMEDTILDTGVKINQLSSMLNKAKNMLSNMVDTVLGYIGLFDKMYPNVPYNDDNELRKFVETNAAQQTGYFENNPGFFNDLRTLKGIVAEADEINIPLKEKEIAGIESEITDLYDKLKETGKELKLHNEIIEAFDTKVKDFMKQEARRRLFDTSEAKKGLSSIQKMLDSQAGENPTGNPIEDYDKIKQEFESKKKDISNGFATSISPNYFTPEPVPFNNWHKREAEFLNNMNDSKFPLDTSHLKVMPVNINNQSSVGLDGFIPDSYQGLDGITVDNKTDASRGAIALVYVYNMEGDRLYYVDKDGNLLEPVGQKVDPSKMVFTYLENATLNRTGEQRQGEPKFSNKNGYSKEQIDQIAANALEQRKELLNSKGTNIHEFSVSRGIPNEAKFSDGKVIPTANSVVNAGISTQSDLTTPMITIVTTKNANSVDTAKGIGSIVINEQTVRFPLGRPILTKGNNVAFLNNRTLSETEGKKIFRVFKAAAQQMLDSFTTTGKMSIDPRFAQYLSRVLYFNHRIKEGGPSRNQVYFDTAGNLVMGSNAIKVTPENINAAESFITSFLTGAYHNVNWYQLQNDSPFEEIIDVDDNGKIKTVLWKSYQHYLLSPIYDLQKGSDNADLDGKSRGEVPLNVNIVTPQVQNGIKEVPFVQKHITVKGYAEFTPKIKEVPKAEPKVEAKSESAPMRTALDLPKEIKKVVGGVEYTITLDGTTTNIIKGAGNMTIAFSAKFNDAGQEEITIDEVTTSPEIVDKAKGIVAAAIISDAINDVKAQLAEMQTKAEVAPAPAPAQQTPTEQESDEDKAIKALREKARNDASDLDDEEVYSRVTPTESFKVEDIEGFKAWMAENLPNVEIKVVNNLIKATGGGYAWGSYKNGYITLYNGAPEGTGYHEAGEAVWNSFLDTREQTDLLKEFWNREGTFVDRLTGKTISFNEASSTQAKEQIMDEFADFKNGGVVKSQPKKLSFFKRLLKFIKDFIFGNPLTIAEFFSRIDSAYYKNAVPQSSMSIPAYSKRPHSINQVGESWLSDVMQGMSSLIFSKIFFNNGQIISVAEGDMTKDKIFDNLKAELTDFFERRLPASKEINDLQLKILLYGTKKGNFKGWYYIKENWGDFVDTNLSFMRPLGVAFRKEVVREDAEDIQEETNNTITQDALVIGANENQNFREYDRDVLKIDNFQAANAAIRLAFYTLPKAFSRDAIINMDTPDRIKAAKIMRSAMQLPMLEDGKEMFYKVMEALAGTTGLNKMQQKLKNLASITPSLVRFYDRLFKNEPAKRNMNEWKMLMQFENTMAKQKPNYVIQVFDAGGNSYSIDANLNKDSDKILEDWISNLRGKVDDNSGLVTFDKRSNMIVLNSTRIKTIPTNTENVVDFLEEIGFPFNKIMMNKLSKKNRNEVLRLAKNMYNQVKSTPIQIANRRAMGKNSDGIVTDTKKLAQMAVKANGAILSSTHYNIEREAVQNYVLPNYMSMVMNRINQAGSIENLLNMLPYLKNDLWCQGSQLLSPNGLLFDDNGNLKFDMEPVIVEGILQDEDGNPTSKLNIVLRTLQEFNMNLDGTYYNLIPADAKTEWAMNVGLYVDSTMFNTFSYRNYVAEIFRGYLKAEINLIKDGPVVSHIAQLNANDNGLKLRFFKDILSPALVSKIEEYAQGSSEIAVDQFIQSIDTEFVANLQSFIDNKVGTQRKFLSEHRVISPNVRDKFNFFGLNSDFLRSINHTQRDNNDRFEFTDEAINKIIEFRTINYMIHNIELHKLFFGDPAIYKDASKRIKSFMSGREYTHIDDNEADGFNPNATRELNKVRSANLVQGDPGFTTFSDNIKALTFNHGEDGTETVSPYINEYREVLGDKADAYEVVNEIDAQSYMIDSAVREFMYKSNGRWSADQESQFQYEMAYTRDALAKKGMYSYSSQDLKEADTSILESGNPGIEAAFYVTKPVAAGLQVNDEQMIPNLLKTSSFPLFYRFVEGTALEDLYTFMWRRGIQYAGPKSQHKVGIPANLPLLYDVQTGKVNLNLVKDENLPTFLVPFEHFGTQVETAGVKRKGTRGSQLTKLGTLDLFDNGMPIDFLEGKDFSEAALAWEGMSEAQKIKDSRMYELYRLNDKALIELTNRGYKNILSKLGITEKGDGFKFTDAGKTVEFLIEEITKRELPDNVVAAIDIVINPVTGEEELKYPLEALPNYKAIKNLIWSVADREITRPKMNGGPKVQVSGAMWEKNKRQAMYKKDGVWTTVEDFNRLTEAEKKTVRLTSSDLKFYTRGENGTSAMEVYLPQWFLDKLKVSGSTRTDAEILTYLNSSPQGKRLLSGIGFRIPTQGLNSMDVFIVKGFLPKELGDAIVVPSELTAKGGSDFDIDKMNTYLKNVYINRDGYPQAVEFIEDTDNEKNLKKLYYQIYNKDLGGLSSDAANLINTMMSRDGVAERIPTLEQFIKDNRGVDPYIVNSKEALENRYFETLEDLLLLPQNFARLLTPNSSDEMVDLEKELAKIKFPDQAKRAKGDINYTNYIDPLWMAQERHNFIVGKDGVGIAAVNNTGHSVSQKSTIFIEPVGLNADDAKYVKDFDIKLRHPKVRMFGNNFISLSSRLDADGRYISDKISQYINGFVDVAKDAWLIRLLVHPQITGTALLLERAGVPVKDLFYFLNQPSIQQYLKENDIQRAVSGINPDIDWSYQDDVIDNVYNRFPSADHGIKQGSFSLTDMKTMMKKYYAGQELTETENAAQKQMLDEFIKYQIFASHLFQVSQASNWDTTRFTSNYIVDIKKIAYDSAKKNNVINNVDKFMKENFIGNISQVIDKLDRAFGTIFKMGLEQAQHQLQSVKDVFANPKLRMSKDDRVIAMTKAESAFVDYLVQNFVKISNKDLNQYIVPLLIKNDKGTVANILTKTYDNAKGDLAENMAIKGLKALYGAKITDVKNIKLFDKPKGAFESNSFTASLRELRDNPVTETLYNNLVILGLLQSGIKNSSISFNQYIPNEDYIKYLQPAIQAIVENRDGIEGFSETNAFFRNQWRDNSIVPKVPPKEYTDWNTLWTTFKFPYFEDSRLESISENGYKFLSLSASSRNTKFPVVKVVKEAIDPETGKTYTREKKNMMAAQGDYSFMANELYQMVQQVTGDIDENGNPIVEPFVAKYDRTPNGPVPRYLYKQINAWGDGQNLQEYYSSPRASVLDKNLKVQEIPDAVIVGIMEGDINPLDVKANPDKVIAQLVEQGKIKKKDCN